MIREKVKELSHGLMEGNTLENGKEENNMEWVHISAIKVTVSKVFGRMVRKSNGWTMRTNNEILKTSGSI